MYGLLIENITQFIQERYGMDKWNEIRRLAQIEETTFNTHTIYPDVYTKNIIDKACQVLKLSDKQFLIEVGESFVIFIGRYGYDIVLSALGRQYRDFLGCLDDLHEYLRLSYPRLRPPSFFCDGENEHGLILHYRTKRNFLLWYAVGQLIKVAQVFYDTHVEIELLQENQAINEYHFILQLRFDNRAFLQRPNQSGIFTSEGSNSQTASQQRLNRLFNAASANGGRCPFSLRSSFDLSSASPSPPPESLTSSSSSTLTTSDTTTLSIHKFPPISVDVFLDIFPFSIIFDSSMKIRQTGNCLQVVCPNILNQTLTQNFTLIKPKIDFTWDSILRHTNTTFELRLAILLKTQNNKNRRILFEMRNSDIRNSVSPSGLERSDSVASYYDPDEDPYNTNETNEDNLSMFLQLKGQMIYFASWKAVAFLGAPNVASLDTLIKTGLYLNDLSMHDFSRDMVLAGQQRSAELKLALDQELHKSRQLEITIKKLDEERRRSDDLLYQMRIADKLRVGEKNIETCQYFPSVTILFSDLVNFTSICSKIAPMQVVNMLNETYTKFDFLTEKHNIYKLFAFSYYNVVYKVETIGDSYMVAGGLPVHQEESSFSHARKVCLMAMDMIEAVYHIKDPSGGRHLKIRIGIHTGPVVGGVVGEKMPRYCLFGDTVNTSSRMETSSLKMRVQISESTQRLLDNNEWDIRERGTIRLKGKGFMKTYWLNCRKPPGGPAGQARILSSVDLIEGNNCKNRVCPFDSEQMDIMEIASRPSFGTLSMARRNSSSDAVHDSNCSLFVRDRIKRTCTIL